MKERIEYTASGPEDGSVTLKYENFENRQITVIGSEHGSIKAADLIRETSSQIENPNGWIFLVEGGEIMADAIETETANNIAKEKGIPLADPIINPFNADIIKLLAGSRLVADGIDQKLALGQIAEYINQGFGYPSELTAIVLGIPREELGDAMRYAKDDEMIEDIDDHKKEASQLMTNLALVSNAVSVQLLENILRKYPDRNQALLSVGEKHTQMFNMPNLLEHLNLKLTDEEVEKLALARDMRYKAQILWKAAADRDASKPQFPKTL